MGMKAKFLAVLSTPTIVGIPESNTDKCNVGEVVKQLVVLTISKQIV